MCHLYTMVILCHLPKKREHLYMLWELFHHVKKIIVPRMNGCLIGAHIEEEYTHDDFMGCMGFSWSLCGSIVLSILGI